MGNAEYMGTTGHTKVLFPRARRDVQDNDNRDRRSTHSVKLVLNPKSSKKRMTPGMTDSRVVNGEEANIESYPWQIAMRESYGARDQFCGGTILTPEWVISAAHCTAEFDHAQEVIITAGHTSRPYYKARNEPHFQESKVAAMIENVRWSPQEVLGDMAMIKLQSPFTYSSSVQPACLPPPDFDISKNFDSRPEEGEGPVCTVSGWGDTQGTGNGNILQQATLPLHSNTDCNRMLGAGMLPDKRNLCAGYKRGGIDS